jgi:L-ascorbate metabolism protein UlaG (beta-lactamase superfamily)
MRITWYGHAAFLIETEEVRLILDPYKSPDSGGYEPIGEPADLVVMSHFNDRYHSHIGQIDPPFQVLPALAIPEPEGTTAQGIKLETVRAYETPEKKVGDEVAVVHFTTEGLHVVFLGDLGHSLTDEEISPLRGAHVVLAAAGGPPTIDYPELPPLLSAIGPRLVIPMHYKTPKINLNIQPVERFLEWFPGVPVDRPGRSWVEVDRGRLPDRMRIVLLDHAR